MGYAIINSNDTHFEMVNDIPTDFSLEIILIIMYQVLYAQFPD